MYWCDSTGFSSVNFKAIEQLLKSAISVNDEYRFK